MAKESKKKSDKSAAPSIKETTSIQLNVPNELYFTITMKARRKKLKTGVTTTIHDQMIEDLQSQNK